MKVLLKLVVICLSLTISQLAAAHTDNAEAPKYAKTVSIVIETDQGDITLELYPEAAPITVANFLKNVNSGYYDNGVFYRASRLDNNKTTKRKILTLIQGGKNVDQEEAETFAHETTATTGISHRDGVISMARNEPGTANTEFFICIGDNSGLDYGSTRYEEGQRQGYATFGRVTSGMDVVLQIQQKPTGDKAQDEADWYGQQVINNTVIIKQIVVK